MIDRGVLLARCGCVVTVGIRSDDNGVMPGEVCCCFECQHTQQTQDALRMKTFVYGAVMFTGALLYRECREDWVI